MAIRQSVDNIIMTNEQIGQKLDSISSKLDMYLDIHDTSEEELPSYTRVVEFTIYDKIKNGIAMNKREQFHLSEKDSKKIIAVFDRLKINYTITNQIL